MVNLLVNGSKSDSRSAIAGQEVGICVFCTFRFDVIHSLPDPRLSVEFRRRAVQSNPPRRPSTPFVRGNQNFIFIRSTVNRTSRTPARARRS